MQSCWKKLQPVLINIVRKGSDILYTLLLRLGAPLQSWGSESMYDRRDTDYIPTKSGVIGIVAAALGRKRNEALDDLSKLEFGIRVDRAGTRLEDFQITYMGEKLNANLANKVYLSDAVFLAGLACEDKAFLEELEKALRNPRYALFLGRRSCPPTQPLVLGIRENDLESALRDEEWLVPKWQRSALFRFQNEIPLRIVVDGSYNDAVKKDVPVSFSPFKREYRYRYVRELKPKMVMGENIPVSTEHDPMTELG